ncbi:hypothetical protein SPH9361_04992 [Sphingobium sp. CECT 9361]|nr:hypothetical protein SPH9361_04992 [Sphingobium sp. CECT 9361]
MLKLSRDDERQALPAGFVDNGQDTELAAIVRPTLDEVVGPHVPRILGSQPDA